MKKRSKKIVVLLCITAALFISGYIGLITPPKALMIRYFETNRQDFEDIANYLNDGKPHSYSRYDTSVFGVSDVDIAFKMIKLFIFGGYSGIDVTRRSSEYTVKFVISNLFVGKGEPYFIRFSLYEQNEEDMSTETFKMGYEEISDHWYYWYRKS